MPSPTMRTVRPSFRRAATYSALSAREHARPEINIYPNSLAMAAASAGAVPGEHDGVLYAKPRRAESTSFASSRRGSEMQITAESTPSMAR